MFGLRHKAIVVAVVTIATAAQNLAQARTVSNFSITGIFTSPNLGTSTPNNDNTTAASPNTIGLPGFPGQGIPFTSFSPIDTVFNVQASGGTTEYFVSDAVVNNSGAAWSGFRLQLGSGVGANFQLGGGIVIPEVLPPDFDAPDFDPAPTSSAFASVGKSVAQLTWIDGTLASGSNSVLNLTFSFDVPDDLTSGGYTSFTLQQFPIVPEPATLTLSALAPSACCSHFGGSHPDCGLVINKIGALSDFPTWRV